MVSGGRRPVTVVGAAMARLGRLADALPWLLPPAAVGLAAIVVIGPGLMPGVGFWDTGEFQTVAPVLGTAHPTGYPTYVILGFVMNLLLSPIGEPALRMNAFSLLSVAVAAGATVRLVERLTGSTPIAMAAGLGLALTPISWGIATRADPHSLHLAFTALLFAVLVRWEDARRDGDPGRDRWLVAAAALFGLSAGNHSLTLLLAVPIGLYVLAVEPAIVRRPRLVATCAGALVGCLALVYLELPIRAGAFGEALRAPLVYARPDTWDGFWYVALAEQFRGSLNDPFGELPRKLGDLGRLAASQLGPLAPAVPLAFVATAVRRPRYALLSGSAMAITVLFNAAYTNADIERYYLGPALWAWTWVGTLAGVIAEGVAGRRAEPGPAGTEADASGGVGGPVLAGPSGRSVGELAPAVLGAVLGVGLVLPAVADFESRSFRADRSGDTAARRWVDSALGQIEPDAVVVSWWSTSTALWYAQYVEGLRPDIFVVDDRTRLDLEYGEATDVIARFLGQRPVYVIRANNHDLGLVLARYDLEPLAEGPATNVYRVVGPRSPSS